MKITAIEAVPVRVPLKKGMTTRTAHGDHATSDYVIVRVLTDSGLVGLGEATVAARWSGETSAACVAAITGLIGPALVGLDPTRVNRARAVMDRELKLNPFTKSGVEMALWDLAGKAYGVPAYQMLGGKFRDQVRLYADTTETSRNIVVGGLNPMSIAGHTIGSSSGERPNRHPT